MYPSKAHASTLSVSVILFFALEVNEFDGPLASDEKLRVYDMMADRSAQVLNGTELSLP